MKSLHLSFRELFYSTSLLRPSILPLSSSSSYSIFPSSSSSSFLSSSVHSPVVPYETFPAFSPSSPSPPPPPPPNNTPPSSSSSSSSFSSSSSSSPSPSLSPHSLSQFTHRISLALSPTPSPSSTAQPSPKFPLFGMPSLDLTAPSHYPEVAAQRVAECRLLVAQIVADPSGKPPLAWARWVLRAIDEVSRLLCEVVDSAELCRSAHAQKEWRAAAHDAWTLISSFMIELNAFSPLYSSLDHALSAAKGLLEDADDRVGRLQLHEFRTGGIHLPDALRERATQLHMLIGQASHAFLAEIHASDPQHPFPVFENEIKDIPEHIPIHSKKNTQNNNNDDKNHHASIVLDASTLDAILLLSPNASLRRRALQHRIEGAKFDTLSALLSARHHLASLLGHPSFASHALSSRVMRSPDEALSFLRSLLHGLRPKVSQELSLLRERRALSEGVETDATQLIEEHDRRYYMHQMRQIKGGKGGKGAEGPMVGIGRVMAALGMLAERLWGLGMEVVETKEGEHCAPEVIKVRVTEKAGEVHLADVYMDLFSRQTKIGPTATYVQQFPHLNIDYRLNDFNYHFNHNYLDDNNLNHNNPQWNPARVTLLCHNPRDLMRSQTLSLAAAETLWHEWGHVMHVVLSRTKYQHTAGTRCAMDFVETPSTLMELFFWDPRVLRLLDPNWSDGDLSSLWRTRLQFTGLEAQRQIFLAMLDLQLHSSDPGRVDPLSAFKRVQGEFREVNQTAPSMNVGEFSHLSGYASGYYSYMLCKVFSANIWQQRFLEDPFSRREGELLRSRVMQHGGERQPMDLLTGYIENPMDHHAYLKVHTEMHPLLNS